MVCFFLLMLFWSVTMVQSVIREGWSLGDLAGAWWRCKPAICSRAGVVGMTAGGCSFSCRWWGRGTAATSCLWWVSSSLFWCGGVDWGTWRIHRTNCNFANWGGMSRAGDGPWERLKTSLLGWLVSWMDFELMRSEFLARRSLQRFFRRVHRRRETVWWRPCWSWGEFTWIRL